MMTGLQSVLLTAMMLASVAGDPLPQLLGGSRPDDQNVQLVDREVNATRRYESLQSGNNSLDDFPQNVTVNVTSVDVLSSAPPSPTQRLGHGVGCLLSTCLTTNLGSALQRGDEKAGGSTTDPFGIGKK